MSTMTTRTAPATAAAPTAPTAPTSPTTRSWLPRESVDLDCLSDEAAADRLRAVPWSSLVVIGDSVAAGVREPVEGYVDLGFADRLGGALRARRPGFTYVNLGRPNLRLAQIIETQLPVALAFKPDAVLIAAGGNDVLGRDFNITEVTRRMDDLIEPLSSAGTTVVTVGLFDIARSGLLPADRRDLMAIRFDHLDAITSRAAERHAGLHVDTHHHARTCDPAIFASDRLHCNARGHAVAFASIVTSIAERWG